MFNGQQWFDILLWLLGLKFRRNPQVHRRQKQEYDDDDDDDGDGDDDGNDDDSDADGINYIYIYQQHHDTKNIGYAKKSMLLKISFIRNTVKTH